MIKITLVSYINTRPFIDGIMKTFSEPEISLNLVPPAACAVDLKNGDCDLALLPIGAIPDFERVVILPDYCLGSDGDVESVFIMGNRPIDELETILLDRHSRTSNGLAKILCAYHWKTSPDFVREEGPSFEGIGGTTGAVVIGDKAIKIRHDFPYVYDLSGAWKAMTGLPFVFAVWAFLPGALGQLQLSRFNDAMRTGRAGAHDSAVQWAGFYGIDPDFAVRYLEEYMDYRFDGNKHKAMRLYFQLASSLQAPISPVTSLKLHSK